MVLKPTQKGSSKAKDLDDLASNFGSDISIRDNEGEAANHGVYYDDTEYDYMQHMRDLNAGGGGDVMFVDAKKPEVKNKGKNKVSLEESLRKMDLEHKADDLIGEDMLPSKNLQYLPYDTQKAIPDAIAGLQPDMDPRLREALEALEDEEFVDDGEDDDIFQQLARDNRELDEDEFEDTEFDEEDEGWESDNTAKPAREYQDQEAGEVTREGAGELTGELTGEGASELTGEEADQVPDLPHSQDWMADFNKFKKDEKAGKAHGGGGGGVVSMLDSQMTTTTNGGRKKKRKGALTNPSNYSMTSSSMVRTEGLSNLDDRYEKLEERYLADQNDMASVSALSTASSVTGPLRSDFESTMDEFLDGYKKGRRPSKKLKGAQTGIEQLDEVRFNLGPARLKKKTG